jgi:hypothetical protein
MILSDCLISEISRAWTMADKPVPKPIPTNPKIINPLNFDKNEIRIKIWEIDITPLKINGVM